MRSEVYSIHRRWLVIAAVAVVTVAAVVGRVQGDEPEATADRDPYPLPKCVVLDAPIYDWAEVFDVGDREIRVCCEECVKEFNQSPDTWMGVVDERIVQQETPYYPLTTCLVDGKPLEGSEELDFVFRNRLFRLCCDRCRQALEREPAKYFALLNKAVIEKQKPHYPIATCIVSGKPLGKEALDHVAGNQLVRLADPKQLEKFDENPGKYLEELRKLAKPKPDKK
jgi:YHS domain-containing protein